MTALPVLVDANLQGIVSAEMAPIEENLRQLLVDIVRRCQSTVAQNFQQMKGMRSDASNSTQCSAAQITAGKMPVRDANIAERQISSPEIPNSPTLFYQEPPHVTVEAGAELPCGTQKKLFVDAESSDSGYGSMDHICHCNCHLKNHPDFMMSGMSIVICLLSVD